MAAAAIATSAADGNSLDLYLAEFEEGSRRGRGGNR